MVTTTAADWVSDRRMLLLDNEVDGLTGPNGDPDDADDEGDFLREERNASLHMTGGSLATQTFFRLRESVVKFRPLLMGKEKLKRILTSTSDVMHGWQGIEIRMTCSLNGTSPCFRMLMFVSSSMCISFTCNPIE